MLPFFPSYIAILRSYIDGLKSKINVDEDPQKEPITAEEVEGGNDEESLSSELEDEDLLPPMFKSGDDDVDIDTMDKATAYKMEASDLKSAGDYKSALKKFNLAVTTAPPSALLLANRADVLLKLGQYKTAVKDCNAALQKNPDRYVLVVFIYIYLYACPFMLTFCDAYSSDSTPNTTNNHTSTTHGI